MAMIDNDIFRREEASWNPKDDSTQRAYKAGFTHAYFGIDAGYSVEEELDIYLSGRRDGARERQSVIRQGLGDPHSW